MNVLFKKFFLNQDGVAAVEMAWVASFMLLITLPLIDLADVTFSSMRLSSGMSSAVVYAVQNPSDLGGLATVIQQSSGLSVEKLTVTPELVCECNGASANCDATCNQGLETYVQVDALYSVPLMFSYPSIDNPYLIGRKKIVRVK